MADEQNTGTEQEAPKQEAPKQEAPKQEEPQNVDALPEWAQKIIRDTRGEAAQHRTAKQAAEQEKQSTLDAIAQALGLKEGTPDPAKLTSELTAAQAQAKQRSVELAVYRQADASGGDPNALLDSRSFITKLESLDPNASDFSTSVTDAIKDAVTANPKLAKGTPATTLSGGTSIGQGRREVSKTTGVAGGRDLYAERKGKK